MSVEVLDIPMAEQHAMRGEFLGSTESPALLPGCSPYKTRFELALQKRGDISGKIDDNMPMRLGRNLEAGITAAANETWPELELQPDKKYYVDRDLRAATSLDNRAAHNWLGEIKMVNPLTFRDTWVMDEGAEEAPPHIEIQVQHQMMLTGAEGAHIIACVGGSDLVRIDRDRDDDIIGVLREEITKFWRDLDQGILPPARPEEDYAVMTMLYSKVRTGTTHEGDDELAALVDEYTALMSAKNAAEKEAKILKARIFEIAGEAERASLPGGGSLILSMTKDSAGTLITEDMVGTYVGARSGYRQLRYSKPKARKS